MLIIGVISSILTSLFQSLGLILQRKHHRDNQKLTEDLQKSELHSLTWMSGLILFILSQLVGSVIAIGSLPVLVLAPLSSNTIVFNAIFAAVLLGEVFGLAQGVGSVLVAVGSTMVILFGYMDEPDLSLKLILENLSGRWFQIWVEVQFVVLAALLIAAWKTKTLWKQQLQEHSLHRAQSQQQQQLLQQEEQVAKHHSSFHHPSPGDEFVETLSTNLSQSGLFLQRAMSLPPLPQSNLALGCIFAVMTGMLSAQSFLTGKFAVELAKVSLLDKENQFHYLGSYVIYGIMGVYAVVNIVTMNEAMKFYDMTLLVPLSFAVFVVFSTMNTLTFYDDWKSIPLVRIIAVLASLLVVLLGVATLAGFVLRTNEPEAVPPVDEEHNVSTYLLNSK